MPELLRHLDAPATELHKAKMRAISVLRRNAFDLDSLCRLPSDASEYMYSADDRISSICSASPDGIDECIVDISNAFVVHSGQECALPHDWFGEIRQSDIPDGPADVRSIEGYLRATVHHSKRHDLSGISLLTSGVRLSDTRKYELHVAWAILRSPEGPFLQHLRERDAFVYSLGAYSREYAASGYGALITRCDVERANDIIAAYLDSVGDLVEGRIDSDIVLHAKDMLETSHLAQLNCSLSLTRLALAHEVAGTQLKDYLPELSRVTAESISEACGAILYPNESSNDLHSSARLPGTREYSSVLMELPPARMNSPVADAPATRERGF